MRGLLLAIVMLTLYSAGLAQTPTPPPPLQPGFYEAEAEALALSYTGAGWVQVQDGDYSVMETDVLGDNLTFSVSGAQLIIYRELLSQNGATAEICVNATCDTFSSASSADQRAAPVAFAVQDGDIVTITNAIEGGILRLDSFLVIPASQLEQLPPPDPAREYVVLADGSIAALDRIVTGGDTVLIAFGAAQIVLLLVLAVVVAWKR